MNVVQEDLLHVAQDEEADVDLGGEENINSEEKVDINNEEDLSSHISARLLEEAKKAHIEDTVSFQEGGDTTTAAEVGKEVHPDLLSSTPPTSDSSDISLSLKALPDGLKYIFLDTECKSKPVIVNSNLNKVQCLKLKILLQN